MSVQEYNLIINRITGPFGRGVLSHAHTPTRVQKHLEVG